ncbi:MULTISPECIES: hypothetical protein [Pantoea]|uniref:hypothetical protein n=1 Tax=Pantoea TaxID=53335 RepID=UPI0028966CA4|nr:MULTISPECIES: hypothetical protein [Pantoea]MDU5476168.1 hypothetical protein [Pantoea sp.]
MAAERFFYTLAKDRNEKNFRGGAIFTRPAKKDYASGRVSAERVCKRPGVLKPGLCAAACESVRVFIIFLLFIVTLMLTSSPLFSVKTL